MDHVRNLQSFMKVGEVRTEVVVIVLLLMLAAAVVMETVKLQELEASRISRQSEKEGGKVVSHTHWPP
jgi:hypothetical protein